MFHHNCIVAGAATDQDDPQALVYLVMARMPVPLRIGQKAFEQPGRELALSHRVISKEANRFTIAVAPG